MALAPTHSVVGKASRVEVASPILCLQVTMAAGASVGAQSQPVVALDSLSPGQLRLYESVLKRQQLKDDAETEPEGGTEQLHLFSESCASTVIPEHKAGTLTDQRARRRLVGLSRIKV